MSYGIGDRFVSGVDRLKGDKARVSHLYDNQKDMEPLCRFGWNRGNGESFSILRGWKGREGICKICKKRELALLGESK